ncbi:MAG: DnaB-like helicase C-terminal domain-containing protein [Faecalimonas umbilicata]|uniref:replicative DNA helicase n=1 Tax=Faecalimonas umbilicata TaxID=1912855 RepID=UPI00242B3902|nr:DnaB-like helicase C-terminal domain-containing protein [Faecalimonas umbilicata]MCI5985334.1 AAA family ATPase [Faecalimonas umbilicata]MDY5093478.1 DnaB-like helicase C-terminal domain-containing protein [Faecalimonas umbilicata]
MSDLAEKSVIGCLLMDNKELYKVYDILKPDMFHDPVLKEIYREIIKMYDIGQPANLVTITQAVESESYTRQYIGQVLKECALLPLTSAELKSYGNSIVKDYKAETLRKILSQTQVSAAGVEYQIADLIQELESLKRSEKSKSKKLSTIVGDYEDQYFREKKEAKLYTGFSKLDDITGGLEGGDVIVIGARPGVGKSAFTSQIILEMAKAGKRIGFYNLEMSEKQVYERLLSNQSGIRLNRIRRAIQFLGDEKERFDKANRTLEEMDILVSSGTKSVSEIRNECRHQDLDCIIIDYLQLVRADTRYQSRASEVGAISKAIKALAMELNVPIIALSQLNRTSEMRETKEPTMGELREAGDIEQDASIIILLWNLDNEDKTRKGLKVDKNRQGELGKIVYRFDGNEMRFQETEEVPKGNDGFKTVRQPTPFD